jgi:hypothetical protein
MIEQPTERPPGCGTVWIFKMALIASSCLFEVMMHCLRSLITEGSVAIINAASTHLNSLPEFIKEVSVAEA